MPRKAKKKAHGRPPVRTGEAQIRKAQRATLILDLRLKGWSLERIAGSLDPKLSLQRVHQIIAETLDASVGESVDRVKALELRRLDAMQVKMHENAVNGEYAAVDRALAIQARRARYLGLDAPSKAEVGGVGGGPIETVTRIERVVVDPKGPGDRE